MTIGQKAWLQTALLLAVVLLSASLYWFGAVRQLVEVNTSPGLIDQSEYMKYAQQLAESGYTYIGDHNRMPLYPMFQSPFYEKWVHRKVFFAEGKYRNLALSMVLLAGLALILGRRFGRFHTLNLMLVFAFTVYIFKAGWFQAEVLFYFLNFCLFALLVSLLQAPSPAGAVLAGLLAGLAHLTKASILPGLVLFLGLLLLQQMYAWLRPGSEAANGAQHKPSYQHLVIVLLVGASFLATVFPYIRASKRVFGQYFYNVNSTFYMWYDSWNEAAYGTKAHGDREHWPDMPPEEIPSLSKYLREHTPQQILGRFASGAQAIYGEMAASYGYLTYVWLYAGALAAALLTRPRQAWETARRHGFLLLFVCLYFVGYFLLYAWYAPIASGNRLILAQFLPLLFALSLGQHSLLQERSLQVGRRRVPALTAFNLVVFLILVVDIYFILSVRVGTLVGGK